MKRIINFTTSFTVVLLFLISNQLLASDKKVDWNQLIQNTDWELFSKNLVMALQSDNEGLQVSAMQMVIRYADRVNINKAILEVVRLYRGHKNERLRQMALVTIHAAQNEWALGIVKRDLEFEKSPKIKRLMTAVIQAHEKNIVSVELAELLALAK